MTVLVPAGGMEPWTPLFDGFCIGHYPDPQLIQALLLNNSVSTLKFVLCQNVSPPSITMDEMHTPQDDTTVRIWGVPNAPVLRLPRRETSTTNVTP